MLSDLGGGVRLALTSVRDDLRAAPYRFLVNSVAGSVLVPRVLRAAIYRLFRIDVRTANIYPGCTFIRGPISIGRNTFVNRQCVFEGGGTLRIGEDCQIAMRATFLTTTHPWIEGGFGRKPERLDTTVGDRCWIGAGAIITPGVTIGDDCVVGAGSVVTRDCDAGWIYAGVPTRAIRKTGLRETA